MSLFYKSKPYRIVAGDAKSGTLSHAYLLVCPDGANLRAFLKELAVLVAGGDERRDRLIREERLADMAVIPAETGGKIAVGDVRAVIDDAYVKPLESDRKLYVLDALQDANAAAQNKLLKILEEPPENVYFILGSTNGYAVLPTVLSRVKKLELIGFSEKDIAAALKEKFPYREDIAEIAAISGGNLGKAEELAGEGSLSELSAKAAQIALNLTASTAVEFARGLVSEKVEGNKFLPLLRLAFRDMLMLRLNRKDLLLFGGERAVLEKAAKRYDERALVFSQEAIGQAERNLKFNANPAMTYETLFIRILEGR